MKKSLLIAAFATVLSAGSAYAECSTSALAGKWVVEMTGLTKRDAQQIKATVSCSVLHIDKNGNIDGGAVCAVDLPHTPVKKVSGDLSLDKNCRIKGKVDVYIKTEHLDETYVVEVDGRADSLGNVLTSLHTTAKSDYYRWTRGDFTAVRD